MSETPSSTAPIQLGVNVGYAPISASAADVTVRRRGGELLLQISHQNLNLYVSPGDWRTLNATVEAAVAHHEGYRPRSGKANRSSMMEGIAEMAAKRKPNGG